MALHLCNEMQLRLEKILGAPVLTLLGPLYDEVHEMTVDALAELSGGERLFIILDTPGGAAEVVERIVHLVRGRFHDRVEVIVPNAAMSAGTIFALSADEIWMDDSACLGPIDPQVQNKDGRFVPAQSYLRQYEQLIEKSRRKTLTSAEFALLQGFDLGLLDRFAMAHQLSVKLVKDWLVRYKFRDWKTTEARQLIVTEAMKESRADEIAKALADSSRWLSHGRPIPPSVLRDKLRLRIRSVREHGERLHPDLRSYFALALELLRRDQHEILVHRRPFLRTLRPR